MINRPAAIHSALQPTTCALWMSACSSGSLAIASRSSRSADNTVRATIRIMKNLASALSSSDKALTENIRLIPDSGFMRLNFGASELPENRKPPNDTGPIIAASNSTSSTG
ncbi:hypothetical protein D3C79_903040 [compost metagenome]